MHGRSWREGKELAPSCRVWSAARGLTRVDLLFHEQRKGARFAMVWLRRKGTAPKVPQIIAEFDGSGSDAYWAVRRMADIDLVPEELPASTPLFTHVTVKHMRMIRKRKRGLGYASSRHWGAHSCGIGGTTDLMSTHREGRRLRCFCK